MDYNNKLYEIRKDRKISQDVLAKAIDSCRNTVGNIERGTQDPSLTMAYRIAKYFEMSVYDVFPLKQSMASPSVEKDAC